MLPEVVAPTTTTTVIQTQVLPTVLTKPAAQLPFTGNNTRTMMLVAGLLFVLGGVIVLASSTEDETRRNS